MPGQKGNSGGKKGRSGRKSRAEEFGLDKLLNECWTMADRKKCLMALAGLANGGDLDATRLLMSYAYGKPRESVDMSHGDIVLKVIYGADRDQS